MPRVLVDNIQISNVLNISDIIDSLSPSGTSFTVEFYGYPPSNKQGAVIVQVYDDNGNLAAIGNGIPTIKIGKRPKTIYNVADLTKQLTRKRIKENFNGYTLQFILEQAIILGNADNYFNFVRFRTNTDTPFINLSLNIDYLFLKEVIEKVLSSTGRLLNYRIPVNEQCIEVIENGFGGLAPVSILHIDSLYNCNRQGINSINYNKIKPIASIIRVIGRNGHNIVNGITSINPDILRYRAQDGRDNYPILKTADEVLLIKITTSTDGNCTTEIIISGSNYTENNEIFFFDIELPTVSTDPVSYVYTANIANIKASTNLSFYFTGSINITEGNLSIIFNEIEIYNQDLSIGLLNLVNIINLAAYAGQSGELIATLTLGAQPSTTTNYQGFLVVDCCAIDTIAGTGTAGFNGDNLNRLVTDFNDVTKTRKDSSGNLYVADNLNYRLRKIDTNGIVTTIGGNGNAAITTPTDGGLATDQDFGQINDFVIVGTDIYLLLPDWDYVAKIDLLTGNYYLIDDDFGGSFGLTSIAKDSLGNIYYSKFNNAIVYKLEGETTRTIYVGTFNSAGFSGDGGLATSAQLKFPAGLACDSEDNLYIGSTDASGNRYLIRKVTKTTGIIETICGNGSFTTFNIDAADFQTNDDHNPSISVDINTNDIYFTTEGIILKINNSDNKINRFCGINDASGGGFDGDTGAPLTAVLNLFGAFFGGIDVVSATEIYIADEANNRVRQIYCGDSPNVNICPSFANLVSLISSSGSINDIDTEAITLEGQTTGDDNTGITASATYDIDLTDPGFVGHTITLMYSYNFFFTTSDTNTTVGYNNTVTGDGDSLLDFTDTDSITAPGNSERESTEALDLTPYIGEVVTIVISINNTFSPAADGAAASFSIIGVLTC